MKNQRIGYIDAIRGFTMLLVVYNHVLLCSFEGGASWSVNDIFLTFRMPLFFFLSGFLMYKTGRFKETGGLFTFLRKKSVVQLLPTLVFSLLYALILSVSYKSLLLDKAKCGYWFTYTLFFYFLIYSVGDFFIGKFTHGKVKILTGAIVSFLIYAFAKFSLSPSCPWFDNPVNGIVGFANFQYFLFFYAGALVRSCFGRIERFLQDDKVLTGIIVGFVLLQLALQLHQSREFIIERGSYSAYSLLKSVSGFFGIATVFAVFRKNETTVQHSRTGRFLQYIGARTLDIYLIHLILIHTNMRFVGAFLAQNDSFLCELLCGVSVSMMIIILCLLISQVIRCSDTLAKLLFGKVIKE